MKAKILQLLPDTTVYRVYNNDQITVFYFLRDEEMDESEFEKSISEQMLLLNTSTSNIDGDVTLTNVDKNSEGQGI